MYAHGDFKMGTQLSRAVYATVYTFPSCRNLHARQETSGGLDTACRNMARGSMDAEKIGSSCTDVLRVCFLVIDAVFCKKGVPDGISDETTDKLCESFTVCGTRDTYAHWHERETDVNAVKTHVT